VSDTSALYGTVAGSCFGAFVCLPIAQLLSRRVLPIIAASTSPLTPALILLSGAALLLLIYPTPLQPTPSQSDSTALVSVGIGAAMATWTRRSVSDLVPLAPLPHVLLRIIVASAPAFALRPIVRRALQKVFPPICAKYLVYVLLSWFIMDGSWLLFRLLHVP